MSDEFNQFRTEQAAKPGKARRSSKVAELTHDVYTGGPATIEQPKRGNSAWTPA